MEIIETSVKQNLEAVLSSVLESPVTLVKGLVTYDTDELSGEEMRCVSYFISNDNAKTYPWLKDLLVWVIDNKEVSFIDKCSTIALPSMTEKEKSWVEKDESIVTIEIERITSEDVLHVIKTMKDEYDIEEDDLINIIVNKAKGVADFVKVIPLSFDYAEGELVILNVIERDQLVGYVNCFLYKNTQNLVYYATKVDMSNPSDPSIKYLECQNITTAMKFVIGLK